MRTKRSSVQTISRHPDFFTSSGQETTSSKISACIVICLAHRQKTFSVFMFRWNYALCKSYGHNISSQVKTPAGIVSGQKTS